MSGEIAIVGLNVAYEILTLLLIAGGLSLVFGLLGVMNMAHGEFVMLGAYMGVLCQRWEAPYALAFPLALVAVGGAGWLLERGMISRLYRRPFDTFLATWGAAILMRKGAEAVFGRSYQSVAAPISGLAEFGGIEYPAYRLAAMAAAAALAAGAWVFFRRGRTARLAVAAADNPDLAQAAGVNTGALARGVFTLGAAAAGLAGAMLAPLVRVEPRMGLGYLLDSFFVVIVGGGAALGPALGAGIVGGAQSVVAHAANQTAGYFTVLLISILFLWLRPHGVVSAR